MKFNPIRNELFTDDGILIKKLHCPLNKQWEDLSQAIHLKGKLCDHCDKVIIDSSLIKDTELLQMININPETCLKVDLNQENIIVTYE